MKHAPALCDLRRPTINSYRRLVPGFEAPVNLGYSQRNRSAACRIPMYSPSPKAKRVEFRCPDPSCNPYLAFSAMLMAGIDGIQNRLDPGDPIDKNLYDLPPEELAKVPSAPGSLEALNALEGDRGFLLKGDVFTPDVVETYLSYKRSREIDEMRLRPHPYEFLSTTTCEVQGDADRKRGPAGGAFVLRNRLRDFLHKYRYSFLLVRRNLANVADRSPSRSAPGAVQDPRAAASYPHPTPRLSLQRASRSAAGRIFDGTPLAAR